MLLSTQIFSCFEHLSGLYDFFHSTFMMCLWLSHCGGVLLDQILYSVHTDWLISVHMHVILSHEHLWVTLLLTLNTYEGYISIHYRNQVLRHWQFGDIYQVPSGPGRWRRYFMARKKVDTRLEQGRPGRDYRVSYGNLNVRPLVQYFYIL